MGILIITCDHDTTPSEWDRVERMVASANGAVVRSDQPATQENEAALVSTPARQAVVAREDEKLHDPQGEYSDATWQSFSPQKRGSIKRHRNGNDAPFVVAAATQAAKPATPVSDEMAALFAEAGIDQPTTPEPVASPEPTPEPAKRTADKASDLTVDQRSALAIWANRDMRPAGQEERGLADPTKVKLANAFLQGRITLTQLASYPTKGGKSNLAKDIARVAKVNLVTA